MCDLLKFRHVHCTARTFSGKRCGKASSTDPCGLCVWQGRGIDTGPADLDVTEPEDDETEF